MNRLTLLAAFAASVPFSTGCPAQTAEPTGVASPASSGEERPAIATEASPVALDKVEPAGPPVPPPGPKDPGDFDKKPFKGSGKVVTLPGGLKYEDMTVGTGAEAVTGKTAIMQYTGTLTDGTKFDSSRDRGTPFPVPLGAGQVIKGWDQGIPGMKVGGRRKLTIPGDLAYPGGTPDGAIPPGATIVFDVELMDVQEAQGNPNPF